MPSPFAEVLTSLRGTFEPLELDWYVFGAQAALVHGAVRMTADVDVTVFPGDLTTEALVEALEAHGFELRGVEADFVRETRVLPLVHRETETTPPTLAPAIATEDIRRVRLGNVWESQVLGVGLVPAPLSRMTQPRLVVPGDTLMITRRTLRRHHLFRPDSAIRQLYLYTLAICARQFGILVHAVTLMSTHEHLIVTDPEGRYPDFLCRLHRLVSLGTKVLRKWEGPTWDHEPSSVVRLLTEQAVIEKLAYVMVNPVKAGLVRHARDWPGITVLPHELGRRTWALRRPDAYFDRENRQWSDTIELTATLPPSLERSHGAQAVREAVRDELQRQERLAHQQIEKRGWRILGADRVRRLSPYRRATSFELLRDRNPTFAVGRGQKKAFFRAVAELRAFRRAYRDALEQWRAGLRTVVFPQGTWCMCQVHGALVQSQRRTVQT